MCWACNTNATPAVATAAIQQQARALGDPFRHQIFLYVFKASRSVDVAELTEAFRLTTTPCANTWPRSAKPDLSSRKSSLGQARPTSASLPASPTRQRSVGNPRPLRASRSSPGRGHGQRSDRTRGGTRGRTARRLPIRPRRRSARRPGRRDGRPGLRADPPQLGPRSRPCLPALPVPDRGHRQPGRRLPAASRTDRGCRRATRRSRNRQPQPPRPAPRRLRAPRSSRPKRQIAATPSLPQPTPGRARPHVGPACLTAATSRATVPSHHPFDLSAGSSDHLEPTPFDGSRARFGPNDVCG